MLLLDLSSIFVSFRERLALPPDCLASNPQYLKAVNKHWYRHDRKLRSCLKRTKSRAAGSLFRTCAGLPRPGIAGLNSSTCLAPCRPFNACPSFWSTQTTCKKTKKAAHLASRKPQGRGLFHTQAVAGCPSSSPLALFHSHCPGSFLSYCLGPCLVVHLGNCERQPCLVCLGPVPLFLAGSQKSPAQRAHMAWLGTTSFLRIRQLAALGKEFEFLRQFISVLQPVVAEDVLTEERGSCHS